MEYLTRVLSGNSRIKERSREAAQINTFFKNNLDGLKNLLESEEGSDVSSLVDMVYDSSFPEEQIFMKAPSQTRIWSKKELVVRLLVGLDALGVPAMADMLVYVKKHGMEGVAETLVTLLELLSPLLQGKEAPEFTTDDVMDAMDSEWHSTSGLGSPLLNVIASATSSPRVSAASVGDGPFQSIVAGSPFRRAVSDRSMFLSRSHELGAKTVLDKASSTKSPAQPTLMGSVLSQYPSSDEASCSDKCMSYIPPISLPPDEEKPSRPGSLDGSPTQGLQRKHRRKSSSLRELFAEEATEELSEGSMGASPSKYSSRNSSQWRNSSEFTKLKRNVSDFSSPFLGRYASTEVLENERLSKVEDEHAEINRSQRSSSQFSPPSDKVPPLWREDAGGFYVDLSNGNDNAQNPVASTTNLRIYPSNFEQTTEHAGDAEMVDSGNDLMRPASNGIESDGDQFMKKIFHSSSNDGEQDAGYISTACKADDNGECDAAECNKFHTNIFDSKLSHEMTLPDQQENMKNSAVESNAPCIDESTSPLQEKRQEFTYNGDGATIDESDMENSAARSQPLMSYPLANSNVAPTNFELHRHAMEAPSDLSQIEVKNVLYLGTHHQRSRSDSTPARSSFNTEAMQEEEVNGSLSDRNSSAERLRRRFAERLGLATASMESLMTRQQGRGGSPEYRVVEVVLQDSMPWMQMDDRGFRKEEKNEGEQLEKVSSSESDSESSTTSSSSSSSSSEGLHENRSQGQEDTAESQKVERIGHDQATAPALPLHNTSEALDEEQKRQNADSESPYNNEGEAESAAGRLLPDHHEREIDPQQEDKSSHGGFEFQQILAPLLLPSSSNERIGHDKATAPALPLHNTSEALDEEQKRQNVESESPYNHEEDAESAAGLLPDHHEREIDPQNVESESPYNHEEDAESAAGLLPDHHEKEIDPQQEDKSSHGGFEFQQILAPLLLPSSSNECICHDQATAPALPLRNTSEALDKEQKRQNVESESPYNHEEDAESAPGLLPDQYEREIDPQQEDKSSHGGFEFQQILAPLLLPSSSNECRFNENTTCSGHEQGEVRENSGNVLDEAPSSNDESMSSSKDECQDNSRHSIHYDDNDVGDIAVALGEVTNDIDHLRQASHLQTPTEVAVQVNSPLSDDSIMNDITPPHREGDFFNIHSMKCHDSSSRHTSHAEHDSTLVSHEEDISGANSTGPFYQNEKVNFYLSTQVLPNLGGVRMNNDLLNEKLDAYDVEQTPYCESSPVISSLHEDDERELNEGEDGQNEGEDGQNEEEDGQSQMHKAFEIRGQNDEYEHENQSLSSPKNITQPTVLVVTRESDESMSVLPKEDLEQQPVGGSPELEEHLMYSDKQFEQLLSELGTTEENATLPATGLVSVKGDTEGCQANDHNEMERSKLFEDKPGIGPDICKMQSDVGDSSFENKRGDLRLERLTMKSDAEDTRLDKTIMQSDVIGMHLGIETLQSEGDDPNLGNETKQSVSGDSSFENETVHFDSNMERDFVDTEGQFIVGGPGSITDIGLFKSQADPENSYTSNSNLQDNTSSSRVVYEANAENFGMHAHSPENLFLASSQVQKNPMGAASSVACEGVEMIVDGKNQEVKYPLVVEGILQEEKMNKPCWEATEAVDASSTHPLQVDDGNIQKLSVVPQMADNRPHIQERVGADPHINVSHECEQASLEDHVARTLVDNGPSHGHPTYVAAVNHNEEAEHVLNQPTANVHDPDMDRWEIDTNVGEHKAKRSYVRKLARGCLSCCGQPHANS